MNGEQPSEKPSTSLQAEAQHLQSVCDPIFCLNVLYITKHKYNTLYILICYILILYILTIFVHVRHILGVPVACGTLPVVPCICPASSEFVIDTLSCLVLPYTADAHRPAGDSVGVLT